MNTPVLCGTVLGAATGAGIGFWYHRSFPLAAGTAEKESSSTAADDEDLSDGDGDDDLKELLLMLQSVSQNNMPEYENVVRRIKELKRLAASTRTKKEVSPLLLLKANRAALQARMAHRSIKNTLQPGALSKFADLESKVDGVIEEHMQNIISDSRQKLEVR